MAKEQDFIHTRLSRATLC